MLGAKTRNFGVDNTSGPCTARNINTIGEPGSEKTSPKYQNSREITKVFVSEVCYARNQVRNTLRAVKEVDLTVWDCLNSSTATVSSAAL